MEQFESFPILSDENLIAKMSSSDLRGIALDIDETLCSTNVFWFTTMQELFGNPENISPEIMAAKYHLAQNVPYWQGREDVDEWMKEQRKNNELQTKLPVIQDAKENVDLIKCHFPILAYLTVRPQCVLEGTQRWLLENDFPRAPVVGKPDSVPFENGNAWKANLLMKLYPSIFAIVDDNPSVMRNLDVNYEGKLLLYSHSQDIVEDSKRDIVIACPTWLDVRETFTNGSMTKYSVTYSNSL